VQRRNTRGDPLWSGEGAAGVATGLSGSCARSAATSLRDAGAHDGHEHVLLCSERCLADACFLPR
jgi:hypothetical protein